MVAVEPEERGTVMTDELRLPGESLRLERERQDMTMREAADKLHMSVSYVKALETDDYERLPEATFVKGYIRNYANLLKLPPADLLKTYVAMNQAKSADPIVAKEPAAATRSKRSLLLVLALIVILLVVAGGYFLSQRLAKDTSQTDTEQTLMQQQSPGDVVINESDPTANAMPEKEQASIDAIAEAPEQATSDEVVSTKTAPKAEVAVGANNEPETSDAAPAVDVTGDDALAEAESDVTDVAGEESSAAELSAEVAKSHLQLTFKDKCWVSVIDASGKVLVRGAKHAGSTIDVSGDAPLSLVFGNAGAVASMSFDGKAHDVSGMRRGTVKRMQLP